MDEIKNLADSNSSQADGLIGDAEKFADQQTGGQFDSEIQGGGQQVEDYLGTQQADQAGQGN